MIKKYSYRRKIFASKINAKKAARTKSDIAAIGLMGFGIVASFSLASIAMSGERQSEPEISNFLPHNIIPLRHENGKQSSLKVMTLNAAHGRKDGRHQLFQKKSTIQSNLNDIADVLKRENPDLVALQEIDKPSAWSGNFDHLEHLAQRAEYAYAIHGEHVRGTKLSYGTGLLSMLSLDDPVSITFAPSPPTFSKGSVISTITWPEKSDFKIDAVSLHLDFSRNTVRQKQIEDITIKLQRREKPLIVMGDFNCEWTSRDSALLTLAEKLNLKAYRPEAPYMATFPKWERRYDWILISPELKFLSYRVSEDKISDHLGVIAELGMA